MKAVQKRKHLTVAEGDLFEIVPPQSVAGPGGKGTNVANLTVSELLLENSNRQPDNLHIRLLFITFVRAWDQLFRDEDMLALTNEAIGDPHPGQLGHPAGGKAGFLFQFAPGQRFGVYVVCLPSALGQFERSLPDGIAVLLHQPNVIAVDGQDNRAILLIDHAIDTLSSIVALYGIFAQTQPGISIDLASRESADSHPHSMAHGSLSYLSVPRIKGCPISR